KDPMSRAAALCCVATVGLTVAACGGGSSGGSASGATSRANTSAYCNAARQVKQAGDALAANPDGLSNAFATFDKLASVAPGQIAPSVQTLRGFYGRVLTTLGTTRPSQNPQALTDAVTAADKGPAAQL